MSQLYPNLNFTNFPNSLDDIALKSNITNSTDADLVNKIQSFILNKDFSSASILLNENPQLNGKIFNANDFNQIRDALLALEQFYTNDISIYIGDKQSEWTANVDRFNFKETYSPTTQYYQNNMVNFTLNNQTLLYLCIKTPPINTSPTNTNYWRVLTSPGQQGDTGPGLSFTWIYDPTAQYVLNNVVVYGIKWWAATQPSQGQIPADGSQYWTPILEALPGTQIPVSSAQPTNQVLGDQWYKVI